ncbi:MAG: PadR family transcriptional regulator [Dermatophilaceae bacterium]
MPRLAPSAHVILGLLERYGPATPYALDRAVAASIGYFWSFPRSQLYAEAARLTRLGLVTEQREAKGRRRRVLAVTDAGRAELTRWLDTPTAAPTQIVDAGLLRLYFARPSMESADAVVRLAAEQERTHRERLARYEALVASGDLPEGTPQRATLELGLRFEQAAVAFWSDLPVDLDQ